MPQRHDLERWGSPRSSSTLALALLCCLSVDSALAEAEVPPAETAAPEVATQEQTPAERQKQLQAEEMERQSRQKQFQRARRSMSRQRASLTQRHDRLDRHRAQQWSAFRQSQSERSQVFVAPDSRAAIPGRTLSDRPQYVPSLGQHCLQKNGVVSCR